MVSTPPGPQGQPDHGDDRGRAEQPENPPQQGRSQGEQPDGGYQPGSYQPGGYDRPEQGEQAAPPPVGEQGQYPYPPGGHPAGAYQPGPYPPGGYPPPGAADQLGQYAPGAAGQPGPPYLQGYQQPPYGQPYGGAPYGQQPGPGQYPGGGQYPAYNPYAATTPAGLAEEPAPVRRPGTVVLSLVLLVLSTLPFLVFGVLLLVLPLNLSSLPAELNLESQLAGTGITFDQLVTVFRILGGIVLALAVLYLLWTVLAFLGYNWARILLTIMSVGFAGLIAYSLTGGPYDALSMSVLLVLLALVVVGTVALYLAPSNAFFANRRR